MGQQRIDGREEQEAWKKLSEEQYIDNDTFSTFDVQKTFSLIYSYFHLNIYRIYSNLFQFPQTESLQRQK